MTLIQKTVEYFRSAKAEMFKVSWPSRRDTLRYSALIIGISVAVAALFASLDYGFTSLFDYSVTHFAHTNSTANVQTQELPTAPIEVTPTTQNTTTNEVPAQNIDLEKAKPIETPKK